jgi:hypothetical protein
VPAASSDEPREVLEERVRGTDASAPAGSGPRWSNDKPFLSSTTASAKHSSRDTTGTAPAAIASSGATPRASPSATLG